HHADAVALPQTAQKVFLRPGVFETFLFGLEDFRHVAAYHPADVYARLFLLNPTRAHDGLLPRGTAREAPRGCTTPPLLFQLGPVLPEWFAGPFPACSLGLRPAPPHPP